ncbi:MAG: TIGR03936 family radical SAM-associated protein [Actinomycetota bacterium]|nr:TIGR03936 family radical SAM-associated protein [Actinomycetota bacterium]
MQRMRIRYAKRGRLRFTSHRDFGRAFERAVRRAGLPIAFSSGFSPHPRISYAGASPTGAASEAEYLEIGLRERCDPDDVRARLDASLPPGLDVLEVAPAAGGALADRLEASRWQVRLPGVAPARAEEAVDEFLRRSSVQVERMTKKGLRIFDCREAVVSMSVASDGGPDPGCAILDMVLRHGTPSVRPDDVLTGLREVAGLASPGAPLHTRLAQGPLDSQTGLVGDPLAPERDVSHDETTTATSEADAEQAPDGGDAAAAPRTP